MLHKHKWSSWKLLPPENHWLIHNKTGKVIGTTVVQYQERICKRCGKVQREKV